MKWSHVLAVAVLTHPLMIAGAQAQQAGAAAQAGAQQGQQGGQAALSRMMGPGTPVGDEYSSPPGIATTKTKLGPVFVDAKGNTLYSPDVRYLYVVSGGNDPYKFCTGVCSEKWTPVAAPTGAKPTGYWKVVEGAQGAQWAYKNRPIFTYNLDKQPGALGGDEAENSMWKAVVFVPPVPKITAPGNVAPVFAGGDYVLADKQGHALFTGATTAACGATCKWTPFSAGLASQALGSWTVVRDGDHPQWAYGGKPVYVSDAGAPPEVPNGGMILRP